MSKTFPDPDDLSDAPPRMPSVATALPGAAPAPAPAGPLLAVENLRVTFAGDDGRETLAVDGVEFALERGRTLGLVGESGCGKSVTSLAIMGLLPKANARVSGAVRLDGVDLLSLPDRRLRDIRGDRLAMIF